MDMDAKDMIEHINREVDRRWELEKATREARERHQGLTVFKTALLGSIPAIAVAISVAVALHSTIKQAAVDAAVDEVQLQVSTIKKDYEALKLASVDLIKGVGTEAGLVRQELGMAQQVLDDAERTLTRLKTTVTNLEHESDAALVDIRGRITIATEELRTAEGKVKKLYADLETTPAEVDVVRLKALLSGIKADAGMREWAELLDTVGKHTSMLEGKLWIPHLRIGRMTAETIEGEERAGLYFNEDSVFWWITMGGGHTLLSRVRQKDGKTVSLGWRTNEREDYRFIIP